MNISMTKYSVFSDSIMHMYEAEQAYTN